VHLLGEVSAEGELDFATRLEVQSTKVDVVPGH
jgi:hypothetical protein